MSDMCLLLTPDELAAYVAADWTVVAGPHATEAECVSACAPHTAAGCCDGAGSGPFLASVVDNANCTCASFSFYLQDFDGDNVYSNSGAFGSCGMNNVFLQFWCADESQGAYGYRLAYWFDGCSSSGVVAPAVASCSVEAGGQWDFDVTVSADCCNGVGGGTMRVRIQT